MSEITSIGRGHESRLPYRSATLDRQGRIEEPSFAETILELRATLTGIVAIVLGILIVVNVIG